MAISQYENEYYGLSGDVKPLGTPLNGRKFTEMDTSKEYRFDAENQQWLQQYGGGGGSSTLAGLTDVDISNPTDGQVLVYNAETGKWENGEGGGGGGSLIVNVSVHNSGEANEYADMDKTGAEIAASLNNGGSVIFRMPVPGSLYDAFDFGVLFSYESFIPEGMTDYAYMFSVGAVGGDFYTGTYVCLGSSSYPSTRQGGE